MLHHTRLEVLPPSRWRWQRDVGLSSRPSQPIGALIPSSATGRRHVVQAPVSCRRGGGAAPLTLGRPSPAVQEPERVSQQAQRAQGGWPLCAWACPDAARPSEQSPLLRLPPGTSSAASGAPPPRTPPGETGACRRPVGVCTCQRRHAPAAGPGASTRCPGHVFAPTGSGPAGRRAGPGARAPPLPRRPTCETPGRSWPLLSRSVCQPILWHTGRGGKRRRHPARGGNPGYRASHTAGRGAGLARCRAPSGAETGGGHRAAAPLGR
jgi:hypothetical protein